MAASKAKGFEYSKSFASKIGGVLLTVTEVKIKGEEEEYPKGGLELEPEKLGLTDGLISGVEPALTTPGLTTPIGLIWCTPLMESKFGEFKKGGGKAYPAQITTFEGKNPVLTLLQAGKEKEFALELEEAQGKSLKGYFAYVFCVGR
jgi:hypothetical protein